MHSNISRARRVTAALVVTAGVAGFTLASGGSPARAAVKDPFSSLSGATQLSDDILGNLGKINNAGAVDPSQVISLA